MCFKPQAVLLHLQMERSIQGFLLHCQPGGTPREEIWGMSSQHFSIILRTLKSAAFCSESHPYSSQKATLFPELGKIQVVPIFTKYK